MNILLARELVVPWSQGMDFHGHPCRVGPDHARGTTKVREMATGEARWEWFGAAWASGPLAFLKRSSKSSFTSTRPRYGAGGSKPTGFEVGCIACCGRSRWTRGCNIEIFSGEGQSSFSEQTDPGSNRGDRGIHFPRPEAVLQFWKRKEFGSKSCWTKRHFDKSGCCGSCRFLEREELPSTVPDVSAQFQRLEATVAELRKERDDLRQKVEGRSGVWMATNLQTWIECHHSCSGTAHVRLVEFQELHTPRTATSAHQCQVGLAAQVEHDVGVQWCSCIGVVPDGGPYCCRTRRPNTFHR